MKKLTTTFTVLAVCFGLSISIFAQKGAAAVYLNVTIDDSVSTELEGIRSDGGGLYAHGFNSVSAQFTKYGFLEFNSGARGVSAFYSSPVDGNSVLSPDSASGVSIKTHGGSQQPSYLQNMTVGETRCVQTSVTFNFGTYTRTIGYNAGYGTISNTGKARVTRPNADTWIIESNTGGVCSSYDNIARVRDRTTARKYVDTEHGRFFMPMRLYLTRK